MEVIRDQNGEPIRTSHNLRGIREYVSHNLIRVLAIDLIGKGEGKLMILFEGGASYETNFCDFDVLRDFVRRWRNVYGSPLLVNSSDCGIINYQNVMLQRGCQR
jgi:hypothetical protein